MIDTFEKTEAFAPILDRLSKLLPRLASDQPGEVMATVAALTRTLAGAKLDWHDLTARLTAETLDDMIVGAAKTYSPQPAPFTWPPKPAADPQAAQQPKREPSPWPTFGTTSHTKKKLWLKAIAKDPEIMATVEAEIFEAVRFRLVEAPTTVTTADTLLFNRLARAAWEKGIRIDREPPPWPTWSSLSHFGKLTWMDAILREGNLSSDDAEAFRAIHGPYYKNQEWTRKGANIFNRHIRNMWERGWRAEKAA